MFGNWLAETHSENPNIIMEDYLEKVTETIKFSNLDLKTQRKWKYQ